MASCATVLRPCATWSISGDAPVAGFPSTARGGEAFNIMLSMPVGTKPEIVRNAAQEFAKVELANHRFVMVLHTHQANPHVHLAVRAEGRDGRRLNPRKQDLRRWREVFAEKLRGWGIDAEASSKVTRGSRHHNERLWQAQGARARACQGGRRRFRYEVDAGPPPRGAGLVRDRQGPCVVGREGRTGNWAKRSSTTPAGCRACATSRRRNSRSESCRDWSARVPRRRGPSQGGSAER